LNFPPYIDFFFVNKAFINRKYTVKFFNLVYLDLLQSLFGNFLDYLVYSSDWYFLFSSNIFFNFFVFSFFFLVFFVNVRGPKWITTELTQLMKELFHAREWINKETVLWIKKELFFCLSQREILNITWEINLIIFYNECKQFQF